MITWAFHAHLPSLASALSGHNKCCVVCHKTLHVNDPTYTVSQHQPLEHCVIRYRLHSLMTLVLPQENIARLERFVLQSLPEPMQVTKSVAQIRSLLSQE